MSPAPGAGPPSWAPATGTTPLTDYVLRRSVMQLVLAEDLARSLVSDRRRWAAADNRAARVVTARRLERRAAAASRRPRPARAAVR